MEFDYGYADLKVTVTLKAGNDSLFSQLSKNETLVLQQQLYLALNTFINVRGLNAADAVEFCKRLQDCRPKHKPEPDEG